MVWLFLSVQIVRKIKKKVVLIVLSKVLAEG